MDKFCRWCQLPDNDVLFAGRLCKLSAVRDGFSIGQLCIVPIKHVDGLTPDDEMMDEALMLAAQTCRALDFCFAPAAYNMSAKIFSGGHLCWRIIPRFCDDIDFLTIIGAKKQLAWSEEVVLKLKKFLAREMLR